MRFVTIGAGIQDVFLSNSDALAPVCEDPNSCFTRLELGSKADVNSIHFSTGGGATNAAVTFARQGHQVEFIGVLGDDPAGQAVLADLDREGVGTQFVQTSDKYNTGYSVLLLAPNGERTILTYRGASTHYRPDDFSLEATQADWMYVSTMAGNMEALHKLFTQARSYGVKICFNPGKGELSQKAKLFGLLEDVEILSLNRDEMAILTPAGDLEGLARYGSSLVPVVVITDGTNGSIATDGKTIVRAGMYHDGFSVDRTGAGDAFASGFVSQWAAGVGLRQSIIFASANSSSVVTHIGAKAGILGQGVELHAMPVDERSF